MASDACDDGLFERLARGDRESLEELAERHVPGLLHYASSCCDSRADAEAAVRRALRSALANGPPADCVSLRAWLFREVRQACQSAAPRHPSGEFLLVMPEAEAGCEAFRAQLSDYLDGELDDPSRARLEAHLSTCEGCAHARDGLRLTVESLHESGKHEALP